MKKKNTVPSDDDYLMEIFEEDFFEDMDSPRSSGNKRGHKKAGNNRRGNGVHKTGRGHGNNKQGNNTDEYGSPSHLKGWMKVAIGLGIFLLVSCVGIIGGFSYLRAKGEKNLRTNIEEEMKDASPEEREGYFITYNGKEYQYDEDVINFLCLGIDKSVSINDKDIKNGQGQADAVILISINVETGKIKLIAIPRDTVVPLKIYNEEGQYVRNIDGQITLQHAVGPTEEEGCELTVDAVSTLLFHVPIQRYCSINFQAIPFLNDAIGGVDVQALEQLEGEFSSYAPGDVIHLEGDMALDYIRQRDTDTFGSSMNRLERQKQYITNYFSTAKDVVKNNLTLPITIFQGLDGNMCTNITVEDITYLVPELLDTSLTAEDMSMVPGEVRQAGEFEEYHVNIDQLKEIVIQNFYKEVSDNSVLNIDNNMSDNTTE